MSAYNISSVVNPDLKSFIKSCLIIEKWHLFFFSHLWVSFSQILSDSSSASVSSRNPRASLSRPQVRPTWLVWDAHLGGPRVWCQWRFYPGHRLHPQCQDSQLCPLFFLLHGVCSWPHHLSHSVLLPLFNTCRRELLYSRNHSWQTC